MGHADSSLLVFLQKFTLIHDMTWWTLRKHMFHYVPLQSLIVSALSATSHYRLVFKKKNINYHFTWSLFFTVPEKPKWLRSYFDSRTIRGPWTSAYDTQTCHFWVAKQSQNATVCLFPVWCIDFCKASAVALKTVSWVFLGLLSLTCWWYLLLSSVFTFGYPSPTDSQNQRWYWYVTFSRPVLHCLVKYPSE